MEVNSKYEKGKSSKILMTFTVEGMKRNEKGKDDASIKNKWRGVMKPKLLTIEWMVANEVDVLFVVSYCQVL